MTGRYPARIGVTDWIHHLDRKAHTAIGKGENPIEYVVTEDRPPPLSTESLDDLIERVVKEEGVEEVAK